MAEHSMTIEITPDEEALFAPIGTDWNEKGDPIREVEEGFAALRDAKSWTYGRQGSYLDRFFTFEFDDEHVFDICWTYVDETDTDPTFFPHWYFCGIKYGTKVEVFVCAGECDPGVAEPLDDPAPSLTGTYVYQVGDDIYNMTIR